MIADEYEAVVYDLDGTLVRLAVDWEAAAEPIRPIVEAHGGDGTADDALDLLPVAESLGIADEIEPHLASAERAGAADAVRLPTLTEFVETDLPVAVCSLNCEAACRRALRVHGVEDVDVVVGRDSVEERKPHPQPLLTAVERLGVRPGGTLFVGDSDSDAVTAQRAGTAFRRV